MTLYDSSYKHWQGKHLGIWRRRATIALHGLRGCLQNKWTRYALTLAWGGALVQVAILFVIGQLLIPDSLVVRWLANLSPQVQTFARGLTTWLSDHPEISVHSTQNLLFFYFTKWLKTLSIGVVTLAVPLLISRDLFSQAILVYSSKAVSRFDYLLGKFSSIFALLALCWLGPLCAVWFFGNLLATDWHFFWHSRYALAHTVAYVAASMFTLSLLALGVSAISSKERTAVSIWVLSWIIGNAFVPLSQETKPWLKFFSFSYDLDQLAILIFRLRNDLQLVQENVPVFGQLLRNVKPKTMSALANPEWENAVYALAAMLILMAIILWRKVRPE